MKQLIVKKSFKKDLESVELRGILNDNDKLKLATIKNLLLDSKPLGKEYTDHPLKGNYIGFRECHLKPNLLLVYQTDSEAVRFVRLCTHDELKKK